MKNWYKKTINIHPIGYPYIVVSFLITLLLTLIAGFGLFMLGMIVTVWIALFFRNPQRVIPKEKGIIVSPADGIVTKIETIKSPAIMHDKQTYTRISIFLSVFDVHMNRVPITGTLLKKTYHKGKFVNATNDKDSKDNERMEYVINHQGVPIGCVQIAGLIARRIVSFVHAKDTVVQGTLLGLIRFGSRCDVYVPQGADIRVLKGQRMVGGETVLVSIASLFSKPQKQPVAKVETVAKTTTSKSKPKPKPSTPSTLLNR